MKQELATRTSELAAEKIRRETAEVKVANVLAHTEVLDDVTRELRALRDNQPLIDWEAKLEDYLARKEKQGDAAVTLANLTNYLGPWKDWLMKARARPTDQRIKTYLEEVRNYGRASYKKVGEEIVLFVNHFAGQGHKVELIPPCGPEKSKARLEMPKEVVGALTTHVGARMQSFNPPKQKCEKLIAKARLAKYLGKYDRSAQKEAARARGVLTERPRPGLMPDALPTKLVYVFRCGVEPARACEGWQAAAGRGPLG